MNVLALGLRVMLMKERLQKCGCDIICTIMRFSFKDAWDMQQTRKTILKENLKILRTHYLTHHFPAYVTDAAASALMVTAASALKWQFRWAVFAIMLTTGNATMHGTITPLLQIRLQNQVSNVRRV